VDGRYAKHPIVKAVYDIFGPTDVYGASPNFPADATILVWGQTLTGMQPTDPPNVKKAIMPLVWLRDYKTPSGRTSKILCSTIGAATDFESEDLRRMMVNACLHLTGLPVPDKADATPVGEFKPTPFGFNGYRKGVKVSDHAQ